MGQPSKPPKKKRPLAFLKTAPKHAPALEAHTDDDKEEEDDDLELFRRSKDFFPVVAKEQEEPRKATPEAEGDDRKHEFDNASTPSPPRSAKRRRMSHPPVQPSPYHESYEDLYGPATPPRCVSRSPTPSKRKSFLKTTTPSPAEPLSHSTPSTERSQGEEATKLVQSDLFPTPSRSNSNHTAADDSATLDEEDEDNFNVNEASNHAVSHKSTRSRSKSDTLPPEPEERSPAVVDIADSDGDDDMNDSASETKEDKYSYFAQRVAQREAAEAAARAALSPEGQDEKRRQAMTIVNIFIHPRFAKGQNLGVFGVRRGLTQDIGMVRQATVTWAQNAGANLTEEEAASIFLTWKGRRILDCVTGVSLGWQPTASGLSQSAIPAPGYDRGGFLLEAWTQEDLDRHMEEEQRQKLVDRGELVEEIDDEEAPLEAQEPMIVVILKGKDVDPLRCKVCPDHPIRILVKQYRMRCKVPEDRKIELRFEGLPLDPEQIVEEAEIENMDTVEVYLK